MSNTRADSIRVVHPLFQAEGGGSIPTSALQLRIEPMSFATAKELNRLWHSRLPRLGTGFIKNQPFLCYGAEFDGLWYATAIWSNPVARLLPQQTWLELRRLAVSPDAVKNTPSRMLAIMGQLVRKARPGVLRLISYQDAEVHTGGIYKAAGWERAKLPTNKSCRSWGCKSRPRPAAQSEAVKRCWDKCLVCSMTVDPCEVCRDRLERYADETGTATAEPAGAGADLPPRELPGREADAAGRDALPGAPVGVTPAPDRGREEVDR